MNEKQPCGQLFQLRYFKEKKDFPKEKETKWYSSNGIALIMFLKGNNFSKEKGNNFH
jgi:hypothetical protein